MNFLNFIKRIFYRQFGLFFLIALGALSLEALVQLGGNAGTGINARYPELQGMVRAFTVLAWAESLVLLIRLIIQPSLDVQKIVNEADNSPASAAAIYVSTGVFTLARVVLYLYIAGMFPSAVVM